MKGVSARYHLPPVGVKKAPTEHIDAIDRKRVAKAEIAVPQNAEDVEDNQSKHPAVQGEGGGTEDTGHS